MEVIFLQTARKDIRNAYEWYENKQYGLGNKFIREVILHSQKLKRESIEYRKYISDIQCLQLQKFPFSVYFFKEGFDKILIIGVLHNRQNILKILRDRK